MICARTYMMLILLACLTACKFSSESQNRGMTITEVQLTTDNAGHFLNSTQVFSKDDEWIVFDGRNHDTMIGSTSVISMVNTKTGEIKKLYETQNASAWGPGVGAATFSPTADTVIFIHGIRNANKEKPYSFTRRTGVGIDINKPFQPVFFDARDVKAPFTNGALRGGTHAHTWSGDGKWISFTYNDYVLQQSERHNPAIKDLRTIGIMIPGMNVRVKDTTDPENNHGAMFSILVAPVVPEPRPGSDEIRKAFDETWIGKNGYLKADGRRQKKAIAYQGQVIDKNGMAKNEIFIADIPDDILSTAMNEDLRGTDTSRPKVPERITRRRITFTEQGVTESPRHWLRTNAAGTRIGYLAKDTNGLVQLFEVSTEEGVHPPRQVTSLEWSIQGPINYSPDGKMVSFIADNSVFITDLENGKCTRLTKRAHEENKPVGAVNWSNDGTMLAYNRYVEVPGGKFMQIFLVKLNRN